MQIDNCIKVVTRRGITGLAYGPYVENVFHIGWNTVLANIADAKLQARESLHAFWSTHDLCTALSPLLSTQIELRVYDLSEAHPVADRLDNLTGIEVSAGASLPPQVALAATAWCSPYAGPHGAVSKRQSLQNRAFIGPWHSGSAGSDGRPSAGATAHLLLAFQNYVTSFPSVGGVASVFPVVASPTNGSASAIEGGWIDNAWDIQRRRHFDPTAYVGDRPT